MEANSRVAFSRPGNMIRIPDVNYNAEKNLFTVNASSEYLSSSQSSTALSVNALTKSGYVYAISFIKPVSPINSTELGLHFQTNILEYGDFKIHAGMQDFIFRQGTDTLNSDGLDTKGLSFFSVISTIKSFDDYSIATHLGFGTGKINQDSHLFNSNPKQNIGIFLGFNFTTNLLKKNGGLDFMTEFDGKGLNIGLSIPITLEMYFPVDE